MFPFFPFGFVEKGSVSSATGSATTTTLATCKCGTLNTHDLEPWEEFDERIQFLSFFISVSFQYSGLHSHLIGYGKIVTALILLVTLDDSLLRIHMETLSRVPSY